jgi:hypothetical protein
LNCNLYLAAKLGIADVSDDRPKTIAQLAAATNTEPRSNGFELTRVIPTPSMFSVIEAEKMMKPENRVALVTGTTLEIEKEIDTALFKNVWKL